MKYLFYAITILFALKVNAQDTYLQLTEKAEDIVNKEDTVNYKIASNLLEEAFEKYPDSINGDGLYYALFLASELKYADRGFKYFRWLYEMEVDEYGYPWWTYVLDDYAEEDYGNLMTDKRWHDLKIKAQVEQRIFLEGLEIAEKEFFSISPYKLDTTINGKGLYENIERYNPYLPKKQQNYSIALKVNDTTTTSYFVHLPENYDPKKKYPAVVFLHGAVRYSVFKEYQIAQDVLGGWNRFYSKYAAMNDVILIYPSANEKYNWVTNDAGFFMIPTIVKQIKTAINLDDNKIFISGHSNGATGSFSYAMKQPSQFAGFYGFNTYPKVFTGGTFIENLSNRSYINFSTDQDYYYHPNSNDSLTKQMNLLHLDYKDYRYNGFPHWFPEFDASEPAYEILFSDLVKRERIPFPATIIWELDDNEYGNIDWLTGIELDTLIAKESWQKSVNFDVKKQLIYDDNDSLVEVDVDKKAFDFPRKSGKVIAEYAANVFQIKTSCIASLQVNFSPQMIDLEKKVKIYVNGKLLFDEKVKYNHALILDNFLKNSDRTQVWIDAVTLKIE